VIKTVESFFIHTFTRSAKAFTIYHTVWIGGQTIHATIALSGISQGVSAATLPVMSPPT
jgi:hypothetical protein